MLKKQPQSRFLLWVDAVGGFLVCTSDQVEIGQALPGNRVDIPIMGDLSRHHALIRREEDRFIIEPLSSVRLAGKAVDGLTVLSDGDEMELGSCVRLRFRQPHPMSASARLEFLSHHRTQPSADAVLLMADSCVLGPGLSNHVVCRDWNSDVVLYQTNKTTLSCRCSERFEIDGKTARGLGRLRFDSRVTGDNFALSLERL